MKNIHREEKQKTFFGFENLLTCLLNTEVSRSKQVLKEHKMDRNDVDSHDTDESNSESEEIVVEHPILQNETYYLLIAKYISIACNIKMMAISNFHKKLYNNHQTKKVLKLMSFLSKKNRLINNVFIIFLR